MAGTTAEVGIRTAHGGKGAGDGRAGRRARGRRRLRAAALAAPANGLRRYLRAMPADAAITLLGGSSPIWGLIGRALRDAGTDGHRTPAPQGRRP